MKIIYKTTEDNKIFEAGENIILFGNGGVVLDNNNNIIAMLSNLYCNGDFEIAEVEELPEDYENLKFKYQDGEIVKIEE